MDAGNKPFSSHQRHDLAIAKRLDRSDRPPLLFFLSLFLQVRIPIRKRSELPVGMGNP